MKLENRGYRLNQRLDKKQIDATTQGCVSKNKIIDPVLEGWGFRHSNLQSPLFL